MIILASTSHTRRTMLINAGVPFDSESPRVDEPALLAANPLWKPAEASHHLAQAKALDVSRKHPEHIIIGADQVLAHNDRIHSKPSDLATARRQLLQLRGKTHHLISTAVCARAGREIWNHTNTARLTMREFSIPFLDHYLKNNGEKVLTSVGAYQLEGQGSQLFDDVDGDYFTILGLPLLPLLRFLRESGELLA